MKNNRLSGFTLVELVMVIAITGIVAVSFVIFFTPAVNGYFAAQRRAALTDMADTALRRMRRDVQLAVPNSIRTPGSQCFELMPAKAGGRVRMGPDIDNDAGTGCVSGGNCSAWLDTSTSISTLDILSPFSTTPVVADWVVIGNQNGNDVYSGANRAQITNVSTPLSSLGKHRLTFWPMSFPPSYDGGRIFIVPRVPAVFYVCSNPGSAADGTGTGTLYRLTRGFVPTYPTACPDTTGAAVLATKVKSCNFVYSPTTGNTQQSGYVWMQLELAESGESVPLSFGAHVDNVP